MTRTQSRIVVRCLILALLIATHAAAFGRNILIVPPAPIPLHSRDAELSIVLDRVDNPKAVIYTKILATTLTIIGARSITPNCEWLAFPRLDRIEVVFLISNTERLPTLQHCVSDLVFVLSKGQLSRDAVANAKAVVPRPPHRDSARALARRALEIIHAEDTKFRAALRITDEMIADVTFEEFKEWVIRLREDGHIRLTRGRKVNPDLLGWVKTNFSELFSESSVPGSVLPGDRANRGAIVGVGKRPIILLRILSDQPRVGFRVHNFVVKFCNGGRLLDETKSSSSPLSPVCALEDMDGAEEWLALLPSRPSGINDSDPVTLAERILSEPDAGQTFAPLHGQESGLRSYIVWIDP